MCDVACVRDVDVFYRSMITIAVVGGVWAVVIVVLIVLVKVMVVVVSSRAVLCTRFIYLFINPWPWVSYLDMLSALIENLKFRSFHIEFCITTRCPPPARAPASERYCCPRAMSS